MIVLIDQRHERTCIIYGERSTTCHPNYENLENGTYLVSVKPGTEWLLQRGGGSHRLLANDKHLIVLCSDIALELFETLEGGSFDITLERQ